MGVVIGVVIGMFLGAGIICCLVVAGKEENNE